MKFLNLFMLIPIFMLGIVVLDFIGTKLFPKQFEKLTNFLFGPAPEKEEDEEC